MLSGEVPRLPRMQPNVLRRSSAEFIGTFAFVFIGAGSVITAVGYWGSGLVGIAIAHGLALAIMVTATAHISGGHINPAVTFGLLVARKIEPALAVAYWIAQLAGGVLAALLLWWVFPNDKVDTSMLGAPVLGGGVGIWAGLVVEAVLAFFLVWVVMATVVDTRTTFKPVAGFAIGLVLTIDTLAGGPLTGALVNPARALGPILVHNVWSDAWIWFLGPLLGGGVAGFLYNRLYLQKASSSGMGGS